MKILKVLPWYIPATGFGGPVIRIHKISKKLVDWGHEVTVFTTNMMGPNQVGVDLPTKEVIEGITVRRYPVVFKLRQLYFTPKMIPALIREKPDVVHVSGLRGFQASMTAIIGKIKGTPTLLMAHGATPYSAEKSIGSILLKRLYDVGGGYPAKLVNIFVAGSETEAKQYRDWGVKTEKIRIIPSGVDLNEFNTADPACFKQRHALTDERILTWVGRVNVIKGLGFLIDSFNIVCQEVPNIKLLLVGEDGGFWSTLEKQIKKHRLEDKIIRIPKPTREDIVNAFHVGEVFPLSSQSEISPLVLFEAGAARCPVVATNVGGIPEYIKHNENGLLVEYGDTRGFADSIKKILDNDQLGERLADVLRSDVEKNHSYETLAKMKLKVFKEMIT